MSAVKYLRAARTIGEPDQEISGPLGRALTQLGQEPDALPELEKAQWLAPDSVDAIVNLAGVYATQEHLQEASKLLQTFVARHPNLQEAEQTRLMFCFLECDDEKSARSQAEKILTIVPNDLIARGVVARAALGEKDFPAARQHLEAILKQEPNDAGALYLYGNVLYALGDKDSALLQWQKAIVINPKALDPYERLGDAYRERGDSVRAAIAYENLAQRSPSDLTARRAAIALSKAGEKEKAAYWHAIAAGFAGDYQTAVREGQVAAASSDPVIHRKGLGAIAESYRGLKQRGPYMATMQRLTKAGSVDDLIQLSQAYAEIDDHQKRTECLLRALNAAPVERRPAIQYDLAAIYRTRGMQDEAEQMIDEAIVGDSKNPAIYRLQAEIHYDHRAVPGQRETAIKAWETAVSLSPDESTDWQHLGVAYLAAGQTRKAIGYLEHAIDLEPGSGPAYQELSRAYGKIGDNDTAQQMMAYYKKYVAFDQARQTLRTRARRPHATAVDIIAYGDLAVQLSNINEAAFQYERALQLTPNDEALRQKLAAVYRRLRMPDRLARLGPVSDKTPTGAKP